MKKELQIHDIKSLIIRLLKSKLSDEEKQRLWDWRSARKENEQLFQKISLFWKSQELDEWEKSDIQSLINTEYQRYQMAVNSQDWELIKHRIHLRQQHHILKRCLLYAAGFVLFLGICAIALLYSPQQSLPLVELEPIEHTNNRAILELAQGKQIVLNAQKQVDTMLLSQYGITHQDTMLSYEKASTVTEWHSLEVPRGGEYVLSLADGSRIWLNSSSKLKFPTRFEGVERKVYLERGEAYFEIVANAEQPFYVEVENMQIKVVGTEFNVMAYPEKPVIATTLVEGVVQVVTPQTALSLLPNEQSIFVRESGQISKKQVDVNYHISWKNGIFEFKGMPLDEVAEVLSRWYDVDFVFENTKLKKERFTGSIQRSKSLEFILDVIQETQIVKYEIIDKTIIFTNK